LRPESATCTPAGMAEFLPSSIITFPYWLEADALQGFLGMMIGIDTEPFRLGGLSSYEATRA
jgi:hypothetical protein